jgi:hypothetical protein
MRPKSPWQLSQQPSTELCSAVLEKIVDKEEMLLTVSNTGIYCSSGKVCTVYVV